MSRFFWRIRLPPSARGRVRVERRLRGCNPLIRPSATATRRARRGVSALVLALALMVLFGFVALVVDLGYARLVQAQLGAGADAAAIGAVRLLDGTAAGLDDARAAAVDLAAANRAVGDPIALDPNTINLPDGDVVLGHWDAEASSFDPSLDPEKVNAVFVTARRDDLATWFSALRGRDSLAAAASALAVQGLELGAGGVPYYLLFALPLCQVEDQTPEELMDMTFVLSPAGEDNTGWGAVGGVPSAAWAKAHIDAIIACMDAWHETGTITDVCTPIIPGSTINLGSGADTSALKYLAENMGRGIPWDPERWGELPPQHAESGVPPGAYGNVFEGPVPIFDGGDEYCTAAAGWNETLPIMGYVWGVIYDVAWKGAAAQKNVWVRVDVSHIYDVGDWYGGGSWGVTYTGPPVLVR